VNGTRREFIWGAGCLGAAALACPHGLLAADGKRLVRFGVVSDVHIGGRKNTSERLATALRWLAKQDVDAVMFPGDFTHSGLIPELERFAAIWYEVFPDGKGLSGRKVEILLSTGNHDAAASWIKGTDEWRTQNVLAHKDNFTRVWERLFHEKFELVWRKQLNGITFMGSQWPALKPELERYMAAHGAEFDPALPFFHCQHEHPRYTCHGKYACGQDSGQAGRAFAKFPNAVVISGHSHCSPVDERTVWQGAFTSIGAGCCHEGGLDLKADNCSPFWHPRNQKNLMESLNDAGVNWGGDPDGGCFEMVDVYRDRLVVVRRSTVYDAALGPDWIVPLPATAGGPRDFATLAKARQAPQFAADAALTAEICPTGCAEEMKARRGEPCLRVTIPNAAPTDGCRVFSYELDVTADGQSVKKGLVMAAGFSVPLAESDRKTIWLASLKDLPSAGDVTVTATPVDCFDKKGHPLATTVRLG